MTDRTISLTLNGQPVSLEGVHGNTTLLNFVRAQGLTGSKEGCAEGDCGACTVAVLEPQADGRGQYRAVNACLMLAAMAAGLEVWTADGIGEPDAMHAVQSALAGAGGSQCGYCTPGFVMSLFAEQHRQAHDGDSFDEASLVGNLCRCTGYRPIRDAGNTLRAPESGDPFLERARSARLEKHTLAMEGFYRPTTLEGLFGLMEAHPEARLVAGGTDLALEITTQFRRIETLISLEAIPELQVIREDAGTLEIGAAVPLTRLETELRGKLPLLDELWPWFASRQIRNRATLGGNLGTASPIGDAPVVLLALEAEVSLVGRHGERRVPLADYFTGYRQTRLERGEVIGAVRVPLAAPRRQAAYKVAKRGHDDISSVMAAFALHQNGDTITRARLAFGGVAATPARARQTEATLEGQPWNRATLERAKAVLATEFQPISDFRASKAYRERIIVNLLEKFWLEHGAGLEVVA